MSPVHILLVEDSPENAALLYEQLVRLWPEPTTTYTITENLADAHKACALHEPSLVVLDLNLPDSSGLRTLDAMTGRLSAHIPIVVISGYITRLEGLQALHRGAEAFLLKGADWSVQTVCAKVSAAWARTEGRKWRQGKVRAPLEIVRDITGSAGRSMRKRWQGFYGLLGAAALCGIVIFAARLSAMSLVWGYRLSGIYHTPNCPQYPKPPVDVKRWEAFLTKDDAERVGYRQAQNCNRKASHE